MSTNEFTAGIISPWSLRDNSLGMAKNFSKLSLHDRISLTVIRPNNTKLEIMVHKKSAIAEVLSKIVPREEDSFVLEAYGVVFSRDEIIADVMQKTGGEIFLLSKQSRPFPVYRDTVAATSDSKIEHRTNIIIQKHWEVFNHTTSNFVWSRDPCATSRKETSPTNI